MAGKDQSQTEPPKETSNATSISSLWPLAMNWSAISLPNIPPAPVFGLLSIRCFYNAYTIYRAEIPPEAAKILMEETAEESALRAAASNIASRAVRVASYASVGGILTLVTIPLAWYGYTSFHDALVALQHRAKRDLTSFEKVGASIGLPPDRSHPDFAATKGMSEQEELNYLARTLFKELQVDNLPQSNGTETPSKESSNTDQGRDQS